MFLNLSPFTFLFTVVYLASIAILPSISDFMLFWLNLEILILLFIGISYTMLTSSISPLMIFFLIQTLSSFVILFSYLLNSNLLFSVGVLVKIGVAPFLGWFLYSVVHFPSFLLVLSCTVHNLPILLLMTQFSINLPLSSMWVVVILNTLIASFIILTSLDLRYLLVSSSIANNSWFLLSQLSGLIPLLLFFSLYSIALTLTVLNLSSFPSSRPFFPSHVNLPLLINLVVLSGLPPSPLFFANLLTVISLPSLSPLACVFLLAGCGVLCSYLVYCINIVTFRYSSNH